MDSHAGVAKPTSSPCLGGLHRSAVSVPPGGCSTVVVRGTYRCVFRAWSRVWLLVSMIRLRRSAGVHRSAPLDPRGGTVVHCSSDVQWRAPFTLYQIPRIPSYFEQI